MLTHPAPSSDAAKRTRDRRIEVAMLVGVLVSYAVFLYAVYAIVSWIV